jgi:hypothetical protein
MSSSRAMTAGINVAPALAARTAPAWGSQVAGAPATAAIAAPEAMAHTAAAPAPGHPSSARPAAHPILNWLTVAQLQAINRGKVHQVQALSATTGDLR